MNSETLKRQAQWGRIFKRLFQEGVQQGAKKTVRETARAARPALDLVQPASNKAWRSVDGFVFDEAGKVVSLPKGMVAGSADAIKAQSAAMAKRQQQVLSETAEKIAKFFVGGAGRKVGKAKMGYQNMMAALHHFFTQPFSYPFKKGLIVSAGFGALYSSLSGKQPSGTTEYGQAVAKSAQPGESLVSQALTSLSDLDKQVSDPGAKEAISKLSNALSAVEKSELVVDNSQNVAAYSASIRALEAAIFDFFEITNQIRTAKQNHIRTYYGR